MKKINFPIHLIFLVFLFIPIAFAIFGRYSYVGTYHSPDGEHEIRIYKDNFFCGFPGSGSDANGYVKLLFKGRVVGYYYVSVILDAQDIRWDRVEYDSKGNFASEPIGFERFAVWKLALP